MDHICRGTYSENSFLQIFSAFDLGDREVAPSRSIQGDGPSLPGYFDIQYRLQTLSLASLHKPNFSFVFILHVFLLTKNKNGKHFTQTKYSHLFISKTGKKKLLFYTRCASSSITLAHPYFFPVSFLEY